MDHQIGLPIQQALAVGEHGGRELLGEKLDIDQVAKLLRGHVSRLGMLVKEPAYPPVSGERPPPGSRSKPAPRTTPPNDSAVATATT
jgi:hypothetical protein